VRVFNATESESPFLRSLEGWGSPEAVAPTKKKLRNRDPADSRIDVNGKEAKEKWYGQKNYGTEGLRIRGGIVVSRTVPATRTA